MYVCQASQWNCKSPQNPDVLSDFLYDIHRRHEKKIQNVYKLWKTA